MDFVPTLTAFIAALIGVFGSKWAPEKRGLKKLPWNGWAAMALAVAALIHGAWTIHDKNRQISDVMRIKGVAYDQMMTGISFLLLHMADKETRDAADNSIKFVQLRSPQYLERIGKVSIVNYSGSGEVADNSPFFKHRWEVYEFNIGWGERQINDALIKFAHLLEPEVVVRVNDVLTDRFFVRRFRFSNHRTYIDEALAEWARTSEESNWGVLGLYYFNAVYAGKSMRSGNYDEYLSFLSKVERLVEALNARQSPPSILFAAP